MDRPLVVQSDLKETKKKIPFRWEENFLGLACLGFIMSAITIMVCIPWTFKRRRIYPHLENGIIKNIVLCILRLCYNATCTLCRPSQYPHIWDFLKSDTYATYLFIVTFFKKSTKANLILQSFTMKITANCDISWL